MQNHWEDIQAEVTKRLHTEFMAKYKGNKLRLAKDAGCTEGALRHLFDRGGNLSLHLYFKLCATLDLNASELLKGLSLKKDTV